MLKKHAATFFSTNKKLVIIFVLIFFSSIFVGVTVKLGKMVQQLHITKVVGDIQPDQAGDPTSSKYGQRVAELAAVPADEVPVEAVIANIDSIKEKNPSFYNNAQNGDVLVLYKSLAIIYSPSKDKVVAMMGFKSDQRETPENSPKIAPSPTASPTAASDSAKPPTE